MTMGIGLSSYEFNESDAWDFARSQGAEVKERGRELTFKTCPYCGGGSQGKDRNSFSINLDSGAYKCLRNTCGAHGNMITLARDFGFRLSGVEDKPKKKYRTFKKPDKPIDPRPAAIKYLESRGISEQTAKDYEITVKAEQDNILVFPFYGEDGGIKFIKYRKTDFDKSRDKNKEWCEKDGMPILFGMNRCDGEGALIITEGQIDSLSVAEAGFKNVVSVPTGAKGFTWIPHCWEFVNQYQEIIVFGDYENGHISLLDEISHKFKCQVKHVREEDYKDCKDANDILRKYGKEQIIACIENAVYVPVDRVVSLASVESVNPFDVEKLKTGITDVDKLLYGGLPFGNYHIIGGKRGDGKSTFASQIIAEAINQGFKTFVYSGELTLSNFRAWLDYQIAGTRNIIENNGKYGNPYWFITNSVKDAISAWYEDKCFIYDSTVITDEKEDLLKTIDEVIRKYGVRVILIDNLMTAIDLDDNAKAGEYDQQGDFAKQLAEIARRYNVMILLVAHRRKNSSFGTDMNDEISGSSKITNLAGIVLGYDRPSKKDIEDQKATAEDRRVTVTKNRLFGKLSYDGFLVKFDEKSKRIYGDNDDLYRRYGWEKEIENDFIGIDVKSEIPFE